MNTTDQSQSRDGNPEWSTLDRPRSLDRPRQAIARSPTRVNHHNGKWKRQSDQRTERNRRGRLKGVAKFCVGFAIWLVVGFVAATAMGHALGDPIAGLIITMVLFVVVAPFALPRNTSTTTGRRRPDR